MQEGLVRPSRTKAKLHLGAIAKTALRFSFLKFKARNNLQSSGDADSINDEANEPSCAIPNGHAINNEATGCTENESLVSSGLGKAPRIVIEGPSSPESEHSVALRGNCPEEINEKFAGLENRIVRIEKQILQFKNTFDVQMKTMLDTVRTLKEHIESSETGKKMFTCRESFEIEKAAPDSGVTTSSL